MVAQYRPCPKCKARLRMFKERQAVLVKRGTKELDLSNVSEIPVTQHAEKRGFDNKISPFFVRGEISKGRYKLIEVQNGQNFDEKKWIVKVEVGKRILHGIILITNYSSAEKREISLINAYDPFEGMNFKWSSCGKRRIYLNSFRGCCVHPEDEEKNFYKPHHGLRHRAYNY